MPPPLFPFDPDWSEPVRETRLYLTNIIKAHDGSEQRVRLRHRPRLRLSYRLLTLEGLENATLQPSLWGGMTFSVPLWQDTQPLVTDASAGAGALSVDTTNRRFVAGGNAAIWRSANVHEIVEIASVAPDELTLAGVTTLDWEAGAVVVPVTHGMIDPPSVGIVTPTISQGAVSFVCEPIGALPEAESSNILEVEPSREDSEAEYSREQATLDSLSGTWTAIDRAGRPIIRRSPFTWIANGRTEVSGLIAWLDNRAGACNPFFSPTWNRDLILAEDAGPADTEIEVKASGYTADLFPSLSRRWLAFLFPDGSKVYREVTASESDGETETLTLASAVGVAVDQNVMISFLPFMRLAEDETEITWHTREVAEARFRFVELVELPGESPGETYEGLETSRNDAAPIELYHFAAAGQNWYLTSSEQSYTHDSHEYSPTAILRGAIGQSQENDSNALEVTIPADHAIAQKFIPFNPDEPMTLVIRRTHRGLDPGDEIVYWTGRVTHASFGDFCDLQCEPDSELLKKKIAGARVQRQCNRILYDSGCGVDRDDFKVTATITDIDVLTLTASEFGDKPDQWFRNGYVEKGTQRRMIVDHVGDVVTLLAPLQGLSVSDEVDAFAGCDRKFDGDCSSSKFDNQERFLGFPWIPLKNPFEGLE